MKKFLVPSFFLIFTVCLLSATINTGCGVYSFNEKGTVPDSARTFRVQTIINQAPYVNAQLTPNLTDRVRQRIASQTRLASTNSDNADLDITGSITDYSVTTTGVTSANGRSQTSINRLTVTVSITEVNNRRPEEQPKVFTVSRSFDFPANQSLQQAENALLDEMIRNLADEIFNRLFSEW